MITLVYEYRLFTLTRGITWNAPTVMFFTSMVLSVTRPAVLFHGRTTTVNVAGVDSLSSQRQGRRTVVMKSVR